MNRQIGSASTKNRKWVKYICRTGGSICRNPGREKKGGPKLCFNWMLDENMEIAQPD